jgi:hypothetical protein
MNAEEGVCIKGSTKSYQTPGGVAPFNTSLLGPFAIPEWRQIQAFDARLFMYGDKGTLLKPSVLVQPNDDDCPNGCVRYFYLQHPGETVRNLKNITGSALSSGSVTLQQAPIYEFLIDPVPISSMTTKPVEECRIYTGSIGNRNLRICVTKDNSGNGSSLVFSICPAL